MGNQLCACCEDQHQGFVDIEAIEKLQVKKQKVNLPALKVPVKRHLDQFKPFQDRLYEQTTLKKFKKDIFDGQTNDKGQPDGYGKFYYHNGCVFVGKFQNGVANGPAHFVLPNGSYYHGEMKDNKGETNEGQFKSLNFVYEGGFKNNKFDGDGKQKGKDYSFEGKYSEGKRVYGTLKWEKQEEDENGLVVMKQFLYKGNLDSNGKFTAHGYLKNDKGEYTGYFLQGKKQGKGEFKFLNDCRYEGDYFNDEKHGTGTLFKKNGNIAFSGNWKNGLPHGKGFVTNDFGDKIHLTWINGLDEKVLPTADSDRFDEML